jgi:hypothetical protein
MDDSPSLYWYPMRQSTYQSTSTQPSRSIDVSLGDETDVSVSGQALV